VFNVTIGMLTPPFGVNLFVAAGLHRDVMFKDVVAGSWPFLLALIFDLALLTIFPDISLVLVRIFM
jgi:C4-dicarboxylate transporter DctM subunit